MDKDFELRQWCIETAVEAGANASDIRKANGLPNRLHRISALGNAVVPQIPEIIGHAILQAEGITP